MIKENRKKYWYKLQWLVILIFLFVFFLREIWSYRYLNEQPTAKIGSFLGKVYLTGVISNGINGDADRLSDEIESAWIRPTTLVVNSVGGSIYEGIRLGLIVKKYSLDVEIFEKCLSSCANYIVPAASSLILNEKSLMAWHGSPASDDDKYAITQIVSKIENGVMRQTVNSYTKATAPISVLQKFDFSEEISLNNDFYTYAGVSSALPICGQKQGVHERAEVGGFYFYDFQDLNKFGIKNIILNGNHEAWLSYQNKSGFARAWYC